MRLNRTLPNYPNLVARLEKDFQALTPEGNPRGFHKWNSTKKILDYLQKTNDETFAAEYINALRTEAANEKAALCTVAGNKVPKVKVLLAIMRRGIDNIYPNDATLNNIWDKNVSSEYSKELTILYKAREVDRLSKDVIVK